MKDDSFNNYYNELYQFAYSYLLSFNGVDEELIERHCTPAINKPKTMNILFERLCVTAQNKQMYTNVIGKSIGGVPKLKHVFCDFDPYKMSKKYGENDNGLLLNEIVKKVLKGKEIRSTNRSIWPQYCRTVIDSAHFLSRFKTTSELFGFFDSYANDSRFVSGLPLIISMEIYGVGFALACDFLKEIGYIQYGKPDVHIKSLFLALGLIRDKNALQSDYDSLKVINEIAEACNVSAFKVDQVLWLVGSGNFYKTGLKIGRHRDDFIKKLNKETELLKYKNN